MQWPTDGLLPALTFRILVLIVDIHTHSTDEGVPNAVFLRPLIVDNIANEVSAANQARRIGLYIIDLPLFVFSALE